jgi:hypothetical protein
MSGFINAPFDKLRVTNCFEFAIGRPAMGVERGKNGGTYASLPAVQHGITLLLHAHGSHYFTLNQTPS